MLKHETVGWECDFDCGGRDPGLDRFEPFQIVVPRAKRFYEDYVKTGQIASLEHLLI